MIDFPTGFWLFAGSVAGLAHCSMLWRAAHNHSVWTQLLAIVRLGGVAAVLVVAALVGAIFPAAAGWATGFLVAGIWLLCTRPARTPAATNTTSLQ